LEFIIEDAFKKGVTLIIEGIHLDP